MDLEAFRAATEAADLTAEDAGRVAGAAIVFVSAHHSEWF